MDNNILLDLSAAFPDIEWKTSLSSNLIRGWYESAGKHHILLVYFRRSKIYEVSLRCFVLTGSEQDKDPVKAIRKLRELLEKKQKELEETITAITEKGVEDEC